MKNIVSGLCALIFIFTLAGSALGEMPDKARSPNNPTTPVLDKITFIHYKKGHGKPAGCNNDGKCQGWESADCDDCAGSGSGDEPESKCYEFISKGAKWKKLPVSFVIHPDLASYIDAISDSATTWDSATNEELFCYESGELVVIEDTEADFDAKKNDGRNELVFGDYPQDGVIAVTIIWGYFYGPPGKREIVEFDILFDTDFEWGEAEPELGCTEVMDLQNIATHELGHGLGLADLYQSSCSEETMYGYSDYCETEKRTLEAGDITGINELYQAKVIGFENT